VKQHNYNNIDTNQKSCDTENWSNDAKKLGFDHRNKLHFSITRE